MNEWTERQEGQRIKEAIPMPNPLPIVPFHKDFSPSGEQVENRKLAHEL